MAEDNAQVITKQETVEVIDPPGHEGMGTVGSLRGMFDKIQENKNEGISAKETVAQEQAAKPAPKEPEKKVEAEAAKPAEKTELEKKVEAKPTEEKKEEEASREALRKANEAAKEEKKEEKVEVKSEDDVPEDELKVLQTDKPKTAKRIQALLRKIEAVTNENTKTKAEATEKAAKLAEYEKRLAEVKTVDPETAKKVEEQASELAMLRRRYELDKDPEVNKKYDSRVEGAEARIIDTITRAGAGKGLLDLIKSEGGWQKFASSYRKVTVGEEEITAMELADRVVQALPLSSRNEVSAAMMDQVQTKMEKERYFKEQQDSAVAYFKQKEEAGVKAKADYEAQVAAARKTIEEAQNKALQAEWLKDRDIPANATPSEKAALEEYNKYNSQLRSILKKGFSQKELPDLLDMITDSVRYYDELRTSKGLRKELEALKSEIKAKQLEINKIKGAGRTVPKAGSIATPAADDDDEKKDDSPLSLSDRFDRIARGQDPRTGRQIVTADE